MQKKKKVDIALRRETHLLKAGAGRLANKFFNTLAFSSADTKTKGVTIVVGYSVLIRVLTYWADNSGLIVISNIEYYAKKIALVAEYAPDVIANRLLFYCGSCL